ncbi:MAG: hypothetical protein ACI857_001601 [Arenicella sp.]|jgi:hypothetical protein
MPDVNPSQSKKMEDNIDIKKAHQVYLAHNVLNLGFYVYFIMRIFNVADMRNATEGIGWPVIIGFILILNFLRGYAKKIGGGADNPIRTIKNAKILSFAASGLFLGGVLLAIGVEPMAIWISILCIPTYITAIALTLKKMPGDETELLDDFFEEEL